MNELKDNPYSPPTAAVNPPDKTQLAKNGRNWLRNIVWIIVLFLLAMAATMLMA